MTEDRIKELAKQAYSHRGEILDGIADAINGTGVVWHVWINQEAAALLLYAPASRRRDDD